MNIKSDEIVTIAGQRGTGKTYLAKQILQQFSRVVVYDPVGEYDPSISYVPATDSPEEFESFMTKVWNMGNVVVVVDEAERFLRNNGVILEYTHKVINTGRHRNIGLILVTRRLAELHKTPFGLSACVILFRLFLPNDIKYISEFLIDGYKVRTLPDWHYKVFKVE